MRSRAWTSPPEAQERFVEWVTHGLRRSVWNTGGCKSYCLSPTGFNFTFWPGFAAGFKKQMSRVDLGDHTVVAKTDLDPDRRSSDADVTVPA